MTQQTEKHKSKALIKIYCPMCGKTIGEVNGDYRLWCRSCKAFVIGNTSVPGSQYVEYKA